MSLYDIINAQNPHDPENKLVIEKYISCLTDEKLKRYNLLEKYISDIFYNKEKKI